jgi:hypothetical protein
VPASGGDRQEVAAALGAEITTDEAAVARGMDRDVLAKVQHVMAAQTIRQAAASYEKGDQDGAVRMITKQRADSQSFIQRYQLDEAQVAPSMGALGTAGESFRSAAPGSAAGQDARKATKVNARALEH